MTAIAGLWSLGGDEAVAGQCRSMSQAMAVFGPHGRHHRELGPVAFGRALFETLPEDRFDRQPILGASGKSLLVADVRLDNREELFAALGSRDEGGTSDSQLLLEALERWGDGALDRVLGDFAFAYWSSDAQSLTLARDMTGQRPLHYYTGEGHIAFASMPVGLHALPFLPREVDQEQIAGFVADLPRSGAASFFKDVRRVEPGHLVRLTRYGVRSSTYLKKPKELSYADERDYVLGLREQLERATKARLRRGTGKVGAHLSAGLDSGAVAATAAQLMRGSDESLVALTAAPREGFTGPCFKGRLADESFAASTTAALHPNMRHLTLRSASSSPLDHLDDGKSFEEPVGHPCNHVWWSSINQEASDQGVSVMLTGEAGNLTISAGGLGVLADYVRRGRAVGWLGEARQLVAKGGVSWRGILGTSFGPWLPNSIWTWLNRRMSQWAPGQAGVSLLHPVWREVFQEEADRRARGGRPYRNSSDLNWKLLLQQDPGNFRKGVIARWKIDERDPTSDRRLAEYCLSVPPEQMLRGGVTRRLARAAFGDRLPPSVLNGPRGYQFADWYEGLTAERLSQEVAAVAECPYAASMLDVDRLRALVRAWPPADWAAHDVIVTYRLTLLRALSAARFVRAIESSSNT